MRVMTQPFNAEGSIPREKDRFSVNHFICTGRELEGEGWDAFEEADHGSEDGCDEVSDDVSTMRGMTASSSNPDTRPKEYKARRYSK